MVATTTLSTYFPPSEAAGGWRTAATPLTAIPYGIDLSRLDELGAPVDSLPWAAYATGVSGFDPRNKATLTIKNGWLAGEYYNRDSARTAVYYLASNGKTITVLLVGHLQLDYPGLGLTLQSKLYDRRCSPGGIRSSTPGRWTSVSTSGSDPSRGSFPPSISSPRSTSRCGRYPARSVNSRRFRYRYTKNE